MLFIKNLRFLSKPNIFIESIRCASSLPKREYKEVAIKVPWGHIAGKWWEPYDTRPILTLHGWQDNCQSFERLIPSLNKDVGYLAIDLPGHGYSSHFPVGMIYHFVHFILTVRSISKSLEWPKTSLMGHSLGSITSYMYANYFPTEVDFLICLDAVKPMVSEKQDVYIARALDNFFKYNSFLNGTEPPSYAIEDIEKIVAGAHKNSIAREYTKCIYERNITPSKKHPGKYYFTRDPRLKMGSLNTYSQSSLVKSAQVMTMPIFIAKATESSYYEDKKLYYEVVDVLKKTSKDCDFHYVPGTHHVHLNKPENLSELINSFIGRHKNNDDRSVGGIRENIIINDLSFLK